ncbi:MAG TPA: Hsp20/alpha crystallin family protein [Gemmatimonadaceae bacterium]|jgi:HSP20 family protein|nr:Hsp20/alpha crystallin family protein [Gemmatimonadaceae bacterium]
MFRNSFDTVLDRMLTLNRAMDEAANRGVFENLDSPARPQLWLPPVDIYETESAFVVEADLPGMHQENVNIQFERNSLTISGTRGATLPAKEKSQLRVFSAERVTGAFSRSIRLPEHVDAEKIEASFTNGVLTITVPKSAGARARAIPIVNREIQQQIQA